MGQEFGGRDVLEVLGSLNMCHTSANQGTKRWLKQFFLCLFCIIADSSQSKALLE